MISDTEQIGNVIAQIKKKTNDGNEVNDVKRLVKMFLCMNLIVLRIN